MKYISVVVLLVLMSWTWCLATSQDAFTLEQYKQVEAGVENDIRGFIMHKYPDTKEIVCTQLYTEAVTAGSEMIAHFRCEAATALDSPDASAQTFEGQLRLKSKDGFKTWSEVGGEIISPDVTFINGTSIKAEHE